MRIYAINGSPRKKWNTATILQNVIEGVKSVNPETAAELINLYDYHYKGCISCFECKRLGGASYGKCAVQDELQPLLAKVLEADILIFGTPVYFSDYTGMMRCFLERLYFPCFVYDRDHSSIAPKKLYPAFIYTMNVTEDVMQTSHYPERLELMAQFAAKVFGHAARILYVNNTYQFKNYDKYKCEVFSEEEKARYRAEHFPIDCQKARDLGAALATDAMAANN